MLPTKRSRECSRFAGKQKRELFHGWIDPTASRPIQPRTAALLRGAPPRPDPPVVCPGFGLGRFVLPKRRSGECLRFAGEQERGFSPGWIDQATSRPTQPRPTSPPRRAPPRPERPVVCPGFGFERYCLNCSFSKWCFSTNNNFPGHALHE